MRAWATFTIAIGGFTGGVYTDPKHQDYSSFAGYRMLAIKGNGLTLAGTDDGTAFWALSGSISKDGTIEVDFSPKGGPSNVQGKLDSSNHDITWSDGNVWQNLPYPSLRKGHAYAVATSGFRNDAPPALHGVPGKSRTSCFRGRSPAQVPQDILMEFCGFGVEAEPPAPGSSKRSGPFGRPGGPGRKECVPGPVT